ncbi:hypothetical protein QVD17_11219 [Tagetes erecta]|uniref:F-box domain-containing protein n=1 Tax=Tagetes erecta TaxID=13708 RepID=A0AAD8KT14_TARER|nr:hypothetical protein QVD17_11219 [Tagetes erecta]
MDRISRLPTGLIETILCLLPIQEAARTSILSREWKYYWTKIPQIAFIEDTFQVSNGGGELSILEQRLGIISDRKVITARCKLFHAIYQVLLMHQGPIYDFTLSMVTNGSRVEIDLIILHLFKRNTIKVLKLDFNGSYRLPSSLFSLHQLTDLYLIDCLLDHLPSASVFGTNLTTLYFQEIRTSEKLLLRLLSSCPLLKRLTIMSDCGTIYVSGDSTITNLFECLPVIEYLNVWFFLFECFLPLPKELPTKLVHLKCLCMECVCFCYEYSVPLFVLLIRSSPSLEKLKLEIIDEDCHGEHEMTPFTMEDYPDIMLGRLKELEILHFSNNKNELDFLKCILPKSPALEKVRILIWEEHEEEEKSEISETLLSFPCASPVVKFIVS